MPSTITHSYFIMDLYDKFPNYKKKFLIDNKNELQMFSQGMDPLFFYKYFSLRNQKHRDFGFYFHRNYCFLYFETLINYIKYNHLCENSQVMSYLYGMLSHYLLDSKIHPYIIFFSGYMEKGNINSIKYNRVHEENETIIDNYFVKIKKNIIPWDYSWTHDSFKIIEMNKELKEVIDFVYKEVFSINNFSEIHYKALKDMKLLFKLARQDKTGIKRAVYKCMDLVCKNDHERYEPISYHYKTTRIEELFNMNKKTWCYPGNNRIKSKSSFIELYSKTVREGSDIIKEIDDYIYNDKKVNLEKLLKNNSYITGEVCTKKESFKHFNY